MKAYLYFIKTKWLVALAYRYELITNLFVQIILLVSSVFFWKAAYGGSGTVAGASLHQMVDYAIVSLLLSLFYSTGVDNRLHNSIRKGNVALDFLKPVSVMGMHFAQDVADALFSMVFRFIPVFVVAALLFGAPVPVSLPAFGMFLASAVLGFLLLWLISAIVALFNFWVIDLGPLAFLKSQIVGFLAGCFIPLWFFPAGFQQILRYLPFVYIYQMPVSIYIGKTPVEECYFALLVQLVWTGVLFLAFYGLQRRAFRNVIVQGG